MHEVSFRRSSYNVLFSFIKIPKINKLNQDDSYGIDSTFIRTIILHLLEEDEPTEQKIQEFVEKEVPPGDDDWGEDLLKHDLVHSLHQTIDSDDVKIFLGFISQQRFLKKIEALTCCIDIIQEMHLESRKSIEDEFHKNML